jgi:hypothetical protein
MMMAMMLPHRRHGCAPGDPHLRMSDPLATVYSGGSRSAGLDHRVGRAQSCSLSRAQAVFGTGCRGCAEVAVLPHSSVRAADAARGRTEIHVPRQNAQKHSVEGRCHTARRRCLAPDHLHAAIWQGPGHLYCVDADRDEAKMSPDSSNPRHVWPWGKPLPRFESPEEEQTFWATHEVEGPPQEVGDLVVSDQSRWMRRARPVSSAGWAGLGGFIGAVVGSFFGVAGAAIGGGVGAATAAYVLAARSRQEQRSP